MRLIRLIAVLAMLVPRVTAESSKSPGDWPTYNRDLAATRYSPLTQINPGNVGRLMLAWTYSMRGEGAAVPGKKGGGGGVGGEVTPIVVNGIMYLPAGNRVAALDPETGKEIWRYQLPSGTASSRGVS